MSKPFYTDYVRHCLRFYARNPSVPRFNTEVDKTNWYACHRVIEKFSDGDKELIRRVYGARDTLADNVYEASQIYHINQTDLWDRLKELEHKIAKKRGLI